MYRGAVRYKLVKWRNYYFPDTRKSRPLRKKMRIVRKTSAIRASEVWRRQRSAALRVMRNCVSRHFSLGFRHISRTVAEFLAAAFVVALGDPGDRITATSPGGFDFRYRVRDYKPVPRKTGLAPDKFHTDGGHHGGYRY